MVYDTGWLGVRIILSPLVTTGALSSAIKVSCNVALVDALSVIAATCTAKSPGAVGVPEIKPVVAKRPKPGGNPDALNCGGRPLSCGEGPCSAFNTDFSSFELPLMA